MLSEAESAIKKGKPVLYVGETKKKRKAARPLRRARAKKDQVRQKLPRETRQRTKDSASTAAKRGIGRETIRRVSLQRSIVWIPLERRMLDLPHLLHPDLVDRDIRCP
ncbi:hypothetical protein BHE74_00047696 [Ensete ventricosum]|nr:hypothetical protein BHE74_00047696 [Ensete ventricosum]